MLIKIITEIKGFSIQRACLKKDIFSVVFSDITKIDIPVYFIAGVGSPYFRDISDNRRHPPTT